MPRSRLIVLKFGGSVLQNDERLRLAVHEIYRWRRSGWRVVAVVSALAGRTDALVRSCPPGADPQEVAAVIGRGEAESAARLGDHLDRAGVSAAVLAPDEIGLRAAGDPLDARPIWLDARRILTALGEHGVAVVPGFVAVDASGRPVTLGRGGSDLTALFLAGELSADRCRLIKDVDGLYAFDPARTDESPPRYARCSINAALETDGSIIQHKAVRLAGATGQTFELGRLNGVRPTVIGPGISRWDGAPDLPLRLRVVVAGPGTVGVGVIDRIRAMPEAFELVGVVARDASGVGPEVAALVRAGVPVVESIDAIVGSVDVVVETIGGTTVARALARQTLLAGRHLVTANKALVAEGAGDLDAWARLGGARWSASASAGGAVPVLERAAAAPVRSVRGVLNGTANFVLERMRLGASLADAITEARRGGFAEADCSRDLDGRDAADKLRVLAGAIGIDPASVSVRREALSEDGAVRPPGTRLRQVSVLAEGRGRVSIEAVGPEDPFFDLPDEANAVVIERADGRVERLRGRGAGRWPTAEAVVGDLLAIAREVAGRTEVFIDRPGEAGARSPSGHVTAG